METSLVGWRLRIFATFARIGWRIFGIRTMCCTGMGEKGIGEKGIGEKE
jgi:hypothetical protein